MTIATTQTKDRKNMQEAHRWLRDNGFDCVRGNWMQHRRFATTLTLQNGWVRIFIGVIV